jgi:pantetheine-phosphate adenylyltransferase
MITAVVAGSFDPITAGHLDIIKRASKLYDKVIVGVVMNPNKIPLFSLEDRVEMVTEALAATEDIDEKKIKVDSFNGLLVDFVKINGARVIIRGLRAVSDFEHEFQMAQMNRRLSPDTETIFVMASPEYAYLSSSIVKEIARLGGKVRDLVPSNVEKRLHNLLAPPGEV